MKVNSLVKECGSLQPFAEGSVVAFAGDSITHAGFYLPYLEAFFASRFPGSKLRFCNKGISGDSATGGWARLDRDILTDQPDTVVVMFGMNDISRGLYGDQPLTEELQAQRSEALDRHREHMEKIVRTLREQGKRVILFTPTPYDQTAELPCENLFGCNDALGQVADCCGELAERYDCDLIHLHGPLTELNGRFQQDDPTATLIGQDRVHPKAFGHLLIAAVILRQFALSAELGRLAVDAGGSVEAESCRVEDLSCSASGLTFSLTPEALPFAVNSTVHNAETMVPLTDWFNRFPFKVTGLEAGDYELSIDGQPLVRLSAEELAQGINLAPLSTPWQRQARTVLARSLKKKRSDLLLRNVTKVDEMLIGRKVDPTDETAVASCWQALKDENAAYYGYLEESWQANRNRVDELRQRSDSARQSLQEAALPRQGRVTLSRVDE